MDRRLFLICLLLGIVVCGARPQAAPQADKPAKSPLRVLIVTGGHGFERDPFFAMFQEMDGVIFREAVQPAANDLYTKEAAQMYDVLVLYDMVQEISEAQKQNLTRLLKEEGKGLVGLHHSLCSYQNWPEYRRILGGQYYQAKTVVEGVTCEAATYDHDQKFRVQIADAKHPITRGMKDFDIDDETYKGFYVNAGVKALLRVEYPKSAPVIGWAHQYGKARVAYLQLGHGPTAFANPNYRQMVRNALFWAARRDRNR